MSVKIAKIEDIIKIVGMNNYIEALDLERSTLKYLDNEVGNGEVKLRYLYDKYSSYIKINQKKTVTDIFCSCEKYKPNYYCPHCALIVMELLNNEERIDNVIEQLDTSYDANFNNFLFDYLDGKKNKRLVNLDVILHKIDNYSNENCFELQLKIGLDKKYVLKRHINDFLDSYYTKEGEVEFGKNFIFDAATDYFNDVDASIIDFVNICLKTRDNSYNSYYNYYQTPSTTIKLSGNTLKQLLKILKNKPFIFHFGYCDYLVNEIIENDGVEFKLSSVKDDAKLTLSFNNLVPITSDCEYLFINNKLYHYDIDVRQLLLMLIANDKRNIIIKKNDMDKFSKIIYPRVNKLKNTIIDEELQQKFINAELKVKLYFEKEKDHIIGNIKLCYNDNELNILDDTNSIKDIFVIRDSNKEQEYINELLNLGFTIDEKKKNFVLEDEDKVLFFLDTALKILCDKYDTYVSKNIKDINIIKKVNVDSTFKIGKDNILTYNFDIENIERKEINKLLDAVKLKKKYYRLKNGDYVNIENNKELQSVNNIIDDFELTNSDILNSSIKIPKYKSIYIDSLIKNGDYDFIKVNNGFKELVNKFKKYKDIDVDIAKKDLDILRDYQEIGVKWMMTLSKCGFGGILADEMGLGKSIQAINYIKLKLKEDKNKKFLIVVPTSLVYNWENEFKKFGDHIKYQVFNDLKARRLNLFENVDNYNVLITSYGLLRQDIEMYSSIHFDTCIIDEAQNIKNVNAAITKCVKIVNADTKFALTGTPIENSILELWSIFDFIMPGFLPSLTRFKSKYNVNTIEDNGILKKLNQQISPFILRRKKKDVLKDLPSKIENNVYIELNEEQKKIYVAQLEKTKRQIDEALNSEGFMKSQILILSLLTKLRQICVDPRLLIDGYKGSSSKLENLIDILKQAIQNEHKILLFSQFPSALKLIAKEFEKERITYCYLDGSTKSKERMRLVDEFNNDNTNVFLISLKAGGTGLNLTSADVVIHLDPWWNPQVENQATDRSHRIGQKRVVEVIKLVTKGTIEEKIIELQEKKKRLSEQIIEGEDRDQIMISKLTEKELRGLLS